LDGASSAPPRFKGFYIGEPLSEFLAAQANSQKYIDSCRQVFNAAKPDKTANRAHVYSTDCLRLVNALDRGTEYVVDLGHDWPPIPRPEDYRIPDPVGNHVSFANGRVSKIVLYIWGSDIETVISDMASKIGKPDYERSLQMQNGYGATWTNHEAFWRRPDFNLAATVADKSETFSRRHVEVTIESTDLVGSEEKPHGSPLD
jgi:hypothetical protein